MKLIPLSQGKTTMVDDEDYEYLNQWKWNVTAKTPGGCFYAVRKSSIKLGKRKPIRMHREIIGVPPPGMFVDHIDGNGLNNQRNNLRFATPSQNQWNRKSFGGASQFKGVSIHHTGKWVARMVKNKKTVYIGFFTTETAAAMAYNAAAIIHHGPFAKLNNIQS